MSTRSRANLLQESTLTHLSHDVEEGTAGTTTKATNIGGLVNPTYQGSNVLTNRATNNSDTSPTPNRYGSIQDHFSSSMNQSDKYGKKKQKIRQGVLLAVILVLCMVFAFAGTLIALTAFSDDPDPPETAPVPDNDIVYASMGSGKPVFKQHCPQTGNHTQVFPNLDYAVFGYNILSGFPLAFGHDPGFTHPIFQVSYAENQKTGDCTYSTPDGIEVIRDISCSTSFNSETIKTSQEYEKAVEHSAGASFGGWGFHFSASADYKSESDQLANQSHIFIMTQAKCEQFFSQLDQYNPPPFTSSFIKSVKKLQKTTSAREYLKFIHYYGTHFIDKMSFGARFIYRYSMSSSSFSSMKSKNINVKVAASYSVLLFHIGAHYSFTEEEKQQISEFQQNVDKMTISMGAVPPSDLDPLKWTNQAFTTPVPISYKLTSIDQLFTEKFMGRLASEHDINYRMIRRNLLHVMNIEHNQELYDQSTNIHCRSVNSVYKLPTDFCFSGTTQSLTSLSSGVSGDSLGSSGSLQTKADCHSTCMETHDCLTASFGGQYEDGDVEGDAQGSGCNVLYRMDQSSSSSSLQLTQGQKDQCHIVIFPFRLSHNYGRSIQPEWMWLSGIIIQKQSSIGIWFTNTPPSKCESICVSDVTCVAVNIVNGNQCAVFSNDQIQIAKVTISANDGDKLGFVKVC